MSEQLHDHSLEMAAARLAGSTDPFAVVQAAMVLSTGEMPNPDVVRAKADRLKARMDLAPKSSRHPMDILRLAALDDELDLTIPSS